MIRIGSLKNTIILQFVLILLPIITLLGYQTISDARRALTVNADIQLHHQAVFVHEQYNQFVDGIVDAVDKKRLSEAALHSLRQASKGIAQLGQAIGSAELNEILPTLDEMNRVLGAEPTITQLEKYRERRAGPRN